MRKLLKLVAFGALLAVGPIQAFAVALSDEIKITKDGGMVKDVQIFEGSENNISGTHSVNTTFTLNPGTYGLFLHESATTFSDGLVLTITQDADTLGSHNYTLAFSFFDDPTASVVNTRCNQNPNCNIQPESLFATLTSWGLSDNGHSGLANGGFDVLFMSDVSAIPEPEIYAMMAIGLVLMGFVARRRRGLAAAA